jgi:polar amino acid transport system substrate-binding protein
MNGRLSISVVAFMILAGLTVNGTQKTSDPRVEDLVRAGRIRIALFPPAYTKNSATGEIGGMQMELARALAARLGVEAMPILYPTPADALDGLRTGVCDVAFFAIDPEREAVVDFSTPYVERDFTYLVPAASTIRNAVAADHTGVRIAVVRGHASTLALSRIVKQAALVYADDLDRAFEQLRSGKADLLASARQDLPQYASRLPGSRVLKEAYASSYGAMAVPKGHPGWLAYISEFIEVAKASGLVRRALERAGQLDARVPVRKNPR